MGPFLKSAFRNTSSIPTTPSAPLRWLRIFFLMAQPPLLYREGNCQPDIPFTPLQTAPTEAFGKNQNLYASRCSLAFHRNHVRSAFKDCRFNGGLQSQGRRCAAIATAGKTQSNNPAIDRKQFDVSPVRLKVRTHSVECVPDSYIQIQRMQSMKQKHVSYGLITPEFIDESPAGIT